MDLDHLEEIKTAKKRAEKCLISLIERRFLKNRCQGLIGDMLLKNLENMIFFVDAMLGHVARKLRLFGFDSEYFSDIADSKLIEKQGLKAGQ